MLDIEKYENIIRVFSSYTNVNDLRFIQDDIFDCFPEVKIMVGFDQKNEYHQYDLWEHTLNVIYNLPRNQNKDILYLSALFHDIGKVSTQCFDDKGKSHFPMHSIKSLEIVEKKIIPQLYDLHKYSTKELNDLLLLIEYHDVTVNVDIKSIQMLKSKGFDDEIIKDLMHLEIADAKSHIQLPKIVSRIKTCEGLLKEYYFS